MLQTLRNTFASLLNRAGTATASVGAFVSGSAGGMGQEDPAWILGNPLRGLTPDRAAGLLESWIRGEFRDTQWLLFLIEQLDADILTLACRRTAALKELSWTIRTNDELAEKTGLQKLAEDQQEALEARYEAFENLPEAVGHLGTAFLRKYALVSIQGNRFAPIDQWWFLRRGLFGPWYYNPDLRYSSARGMPEGSLVNETQYLVRDSERSMFWIALLKFVRANRSQKWWDKFCEIASKNGTVIVGPPNMTPDQAAMFKTDALGIATGGSGVLPNGSDVKATGPQRQGPAPYMEHMTFLREQVVLAGTGGLLTMITAPTGLGSNTGDQHADAFRTLRNADAGEISAEFRRKIDAPLLAAQFPGQPVLAYFELDTAEQQSPSAFLDDAVKAKQAGFQMDAEQLSEKTGYTLTLSPVPAPSPFSGGFGPASAPGAGISGLPNRRRTSALVNTAAVATALSISVSASWSAPVADAMKRIETIVQDRSIDDAALLQRLRAEIAKLPELAAQMDTAALADTLAAGMLQGVIAEIADRQEKPLLQEGLSPETPSSETFVSGDRGARAPRSQRQKGLEGGSGDNLSSRGFHRSPVLANSASGVMLGFGPNRDAVEKLLAKTPVTSPLRTAEWENVPLALRERAFFSAGVENVRLLGEMQRRLNVTLTQTHDGTFMDRDRFIDEARRIAMEEGVTDGRGEALTDLGSNRRLGLIYDMQTQQAAGFARWKSDMDPDILDAFPAQELVRVEERVMPRDWQSRWAEAGGTFSGGRMVALKTDPIWSAISRFGTPWPPFDFGSGMGLVDVDRQEAEDLGLIAPDATVEPSDKQFNDDLQTSAADWRPDQVSTLKLAFGDQVQEKDGTVQWQGNLIGDLAREIVNAGLDTFNPSAWKGSSLNFGTATARAVQEAAKVTKSDETAFDLGGSRMVLDPLHVHHILTEHPDMTVAQIETIPHIWRDPDTIRRGGNDRSLILTKRMIGKTVLVGFDLNPKEKVWQASSARVEKG